MNHSYEYMHSYRYSTRTRFTSCTTRFLDRDAPATAMINSPQTICSIASHRKPWVVCLFELLGGDVRELVEAVGGAVLYVCVEPLDAGKCLLECDTGLGLSSWIRVVLAVRGSPCLEGGGNTTEVAVPRQQNS